MTVALSTRENGPYTATDGQTVFNYTFPIKTASELAVRRVRDGAEALLELDVDYGVTNVGADTGTIILTAGSIAGDIVTIKGELPIERTSNFAGWRSIPDNGINDELDRMIKALQEMRRDVDVSIKPAQGGSAYDMGGLRITNLENGVANDDAATVGQLKPFADAAAASASAAAQDEASTAANAAIAKQARDEAVSAAAEVALIEADVTITVGTGGDYATINAALDDLSRSRAVYVEKGFAAEVKLLAGFVMAEQVLVRGIDLGWITITSEDAEVTIARSALVGWTDVQGLIGAPAFGADQNGRLPVIGALFNMDTSAPAGATTDCHGIAITNASEVLVRENCGVKNAGGIGLWINRGSYGRSHLGIYTGSGGTAGVYLSRASIGDINSIDVSNAAGHGIALLRACIADSANGSKADDCGGDGVNVGTMSFLNCNQISAQRAGGNGIIATGNSVVYAPLANVDDATLSACSAFDSSRIGFQQSSGKRAGTYGLYANGAATISANLTDVSEAASRGIFAQFGATISICGAGASFRKGGSDAASDSFATDGGILCVTGALGGKFQPPNLMTGAGIVYDGGASSGGWIVIGRSGTQVIHTGDTDEAVLATVIVPGGMMGPNGQVRITSLWSVTSSADLKTMRIRLNGLTGFPYLNVGINTSGQQMYQHTNIIRNRNSISSQVGATAAFAGFGSSTGGLVTSSVSTDVDVPIVFTGQVAVATQACRLEAYTVEVCYGA